MREIRQAFLQTKKDFGGIEAAKPPPAPNEAKPFFSMPACLPSPPLVYLSDRLHLDSYSN